MNILIQQLFNLLTTPPGNLVYHLILAFAVISGLQAALMGRRNGGAPHPGHIMLGLSLILLAQLVLFGSSGLAWQQIADPQHYLPPLDRAVTAFSLVWLVWLWCFPAPSRLADSIAGVLSLAIIILAAFTLANWSIEAPGSAFNGSLYDWGWQLFDLAAVFVGILLLVIRRPAAWGTGLASLALLLAGFVISLLTVQPVGDFSGIVRLAQLCAYPLLPVVAQRFAPAAAKPVESEAAAKAKTGLDPKMAQAWMQLAAESDPDRVAGGIARAMAQSMTADLCFLIASPDNGGKWPVLGGYDLVAEEYLPESIEFSHEDIPNLGAALERGRSVRLSTSGGLLVGDLKSIGRALGLEDAGNLLAAPLIDKGKVWGGIVLLSPYANRAWTPEEQSYLVSAAELLVQILQRAEGQAVPDMTREYQAGLKQLDALRKENSQLQAEVSSLRAGQEKSGGNDLEGLLAIQKESQEVIAQLQAENEQLHAALAAAAALHATETKSAETGAVQPDTVKTDSQMETELRSALEQVARLQNALAQANSKILELQRQPAESGRAAPQSEILAAIARELRQPLTSLSGYTGLMLAEEAGNINDRQREYLDQAKLSIERLQAVIKDMVCAANLGGEAAQQSREIVDLEAVVDEAVRANQTLIRQKNLNVQFELPENLPRVQADSQALQQIVADLLRSAGSASPAESVVLLQVSSTENERGKPVLRMQVGESAPENNPDQAAELPVHPGYEMALVQALVSDQSGVLRIDQEPGKSTTYTVELPVYTNGNHKPPEAE